MKKLYFIIIILFSLAVSAAEKEVDQAEICVKDLDFIYEKIGQNSAPYANELDKQFTKWYEEVYKNALSLVKKAVDVNDCYYAARYYVNGFDQPHISLRNYSKLSPEKYAGLFLAKQGDKYKIIYKNEQFKFLDEVNVGDEVTHINNLEIEKYIRRFVFPFYAENYTDKMLQSAVLQALIIDGNRFKPLPKNISVIRGEEKLQLDLKFTNLDPEIKKAMQARYSLSNTNKFNVESLIDGMWIKIPSFYFNKDELIFYKGMLAQLKKDLAKEDYIVFDLRGNKGGEGKYSSAIIRNLWGDKYIKSLKDKHDYNSQYTKNNRVSAGNLKQAAIYYNEKDLSLYKAKLHKEDVYFQESYNIFDYNENLYTNMDSNEFKAKIYVLTDSSCKSTCWRFVRELRQMPGVVHLGQPTFRYSQYSYAKKNRVPSERFDFFYPTKIWVKPEIKSFQPIIPHYLYKGDINQESEVVDWVLSVIEGV